MNINEMIIKQSNLNPDKIAIYYENKTFTYKILNDLIWKFSNYLYDSSVRRGDVIVHVFDNELELIISMLATARLGATVFSLPLDTSNLLKNEILSCINAKFISTDNINFDFKLKTIVFDLDKLMKNNNVHNTNIMIKNPSTPWLILKNSGSTGTSKYLPISHKVAISRAKGISKIINLKENDLISFAVDLNFSVSKSRLLSSFYTGASVVIFDRKKISFIDITQLSHIKPNCFLV